IACAGLPGAVQVLDAPSELVSADDLLDLLERVDGKVGEESPVDGFLASWRGARLADIDDVEWDGFGGPAVPMADVEGGAGDTDCCNGKTRLSLLAFSDADDSLADDAASIEDRKSTRLNSSHVKI